MLYSLTKAIFGRDRPSPSIPVKDKTSEKEQEERWTEQPPPTQEYVMSNPELDLHIESEPPQVPEIIFAIKK